MLSSEFYNQTLPFSTHQSHYRASTQHQPHQCCLQAARLGKGLPSPPPGCTTPAQPTSIPGCRGTSSSCPLLSKAMQPNTQFSWSKTHERPQPSSCTQPPPSSHRVTQMLFKCIDRQENWPSHGYGRVHNTIMYADQATYSSVWEHYQTASPRAGPDSTKATKPSPSHQAGLQITCHPKKAKARKKSASKTIQDRHPQSVVHLHSIPGHHLWHKAMKGDLGQAEPVVPSFPCCSTEVENMYY